MHFVFNSRVTQKVKWYQKSWFGIFMKIIAIVIIVYSLGSMSTLAFALASAGMYGALALVVLEMVVTAIITQLALKLFVKIVGPKLGLIVAVIAAAVAGLRSTGAIDGLLNAPWADSLLTAANGLVKTVSESYQSALNGLQKEFASFQLEMNEANKALQAANELLETTSILSPLYIIGEDPISYYNRTIHSHEIDMNVVEANKTFVARALTLPTLSDTLGDYDYGYGI